MTLLVVLHALRLGMKKHLGMLKPLNAADGDHGGTHPAKPFVKLLEVRMLLCCALPAERPCWFSLRVFLPRADRTVLTRVMISLRLLPTRLRARGSAAQPQPLPLPAANSAFLPWLRRSRVLLPLRLVLLALAGWNRSAPQLVALRQHLTLPPPMPAPAQKRR
jgi:hypothetical protein